MHMITMPLSSVHDHFVVVMFAVVIDSVTMVCANRLGKN